MKHFLVIASLLTACGQFLAADPIRLHPDNPRWFEWRGKAVALITSGEHYGAVLNPDFDFRRYLETMQHDGMNYTRLFAGTYVEPPGAFGIERNTLAPARGRFLAPWSRSERPGYAGGGNRFDLDRFSPEYLARLKEVITEASRRGIVVELTLFTSTYGESQWALHPFNPTNNIQSLAVSDWRKLHTLPANAGASERETMPSTPVESPDRLIPARAMVYQEKLVRWLVRELQDFDNLFFEIQNEPWSDNHTMGDYVNPYLTDKHSFPNAVEVTTPDSVAWQRAIARVIVGEESRMRRHHLIAQNIANFRLPLNDGDLVSEAAIVHFHYAYPEALTWNRGLKRVIGCDETGFAGGADATYRWQAWNFVFSGGGLFNNLDYSFTVGREDGTDSANKAPGGGSPTLRRQLRVLSDFLHGFDLAALQPDADFVLRAPGVVTRTLSSPGKAYAVYVQGRGLTNLSLNLSKGSWTVEWVSTEDGSVLKREAVSSEGKPIELMSPPFTDSVALKLVH
jgi:hypothetical protein